MNEHVTTNENGKSLYKLIGELKAQLEEAQRVNAGLLKSNQHLINQMESLSSRLTVLETQGTERRFLCDIHHQSIEETKTRMGKVETAIATLEGSWKTYMAVGGFSGVFGAIITLLTYGRLGG